MSDIRAFNYRIGGTLTYTANGSLMLIWHLQSNGEGPSPNGNYNESCDDEYKSRQIRYLATAMGKVQTRPMAGRIERRCVGSRKYYRPAQLAFGRELHAPNRYGHISQQSNKTVN